MQQAAAPSHSPGDPPSLKDTGRSARLDQAAPTPQAAGVPWLWSYVEGSRLPALLQPLFLHGGQVMSQRCSSEEHHAGQPARPQSSACRRATMQLWVPQEGPQEPRSLGGREGGRDGGGLHSAGRDSGSNGQGLEGTAAPNAAGPEGTGSTDDVLVTSLKRVLVVLLGCFSLLKPLTF